MVHCFAACSTGNLHQLLVRRSFGACRVLLLYEVIFMDDEGFSDPTSELFGESAEAGVLLLYVPMLEHLVYVVLPILRDELTVGLTATT